MPNRGGPSSKKRSGYTELDIELEEVEAADVTEAASSPDDGFTHVDADEGNVTPQASPARMRGMTEIDLSSGDRKHVQVVRERFDSRRNTTNHPDKYLVTLDRNEVLRAAAIGFFCFVVLVVLLVWKRPGESDAEHESFLHEFGVDIGGGFHAVVAGAPMVVLLEQSPRALFDVKVTVQGLPHALTVDPSDPPVDERMGHAPAFPTSSRPLRLHQAIERDRRQRRRDDEGNAPVYTLSWLFYQRLPGAPSWELLDESFGEVVLLEDYENEAYETYSSEDFVPGLIDGSEVKIEVSTNATVPIGFMFQVHQMGMIGRYRVTIAALILVGVYALILSDVMHRTLCALVGSFVSLLFVSIVNAPPSLHTVVSWLEEGSLALLFGMMLLVQLFSTTGFFEFAAVRAVALSSGSLTRLYLYLCLTTAILSAFLDNVTSILLLGPVTLELCKVLNTDPVPFLVSEAIFSNIGGTMTMIGDPPNILIGNLLRKELGFVDFLTEVAPGVLLGVPAALYLLYFLNRAALTGTRQVDIAMLKARYPITDQPLLLKALCIIGTVILGFFLEPAHGIEAAWLSLAGAVALLIIATPKQIHQVLTLIEWDTLLFFAGLFVLIEALSELRLIAAIGDGLVAAITRVDHQSQMAVAIMLIVWVSAVTSAILDNIPFTATVVPVIVHLSAETGLPLRPLAWSLSIGACLGGNGTLVGASANLVMAGMSEHHGIPISFRTFSRSGFPVMVLTVGIASTYLLVRYAALGDE